MKKFIALLIACVLSAIVEPAWATISVTNIGTNSSSEIGTTLSVTVGAGGVPVGALIVVETIEVTWPNQTGTLSASCAALTDTQSNAYTVAYAGIAQYLNQLNCVYYAIISNALVSGNTIKYTGQSSSGDYAMSAFYATGIASSSPLDTAVTATTSVASGTTIASLTSGTPAVSGELFVALCLSGTSTYTQSSGGWATPPVAVYNGDSNIYNSGVYGVYGGTLINAGTGTKIFSPTTGVTFGLDIILGFKPSGGSTIHPFVFTPAVVP